MSATITWIPVAPTGLTNTGLPNTGPQNTRLRITRRGRAVIATLAAAPLVLAAVILGGGLTAAAGIGGAGPSNDAASYEYVTIQSGQSLWQLAETLAPSADPREVIAEIVNLNQLSSESVQPGQRLALPKD